MKRHLSIFAALAMNLMSGVYVSSLKAGESDQKTVITIFQPIKVEGALLPAGHYILKLQESRSSGSILYIFDDEETKLIATVLGIPAYRLDPTGNSVFSFYEPAAGQPPALHTWFYSGDTGGLEFPQRK